MVTLPDKYLAMVVDDEPDVHAVTRLNLKGMRYGARPVELVSAATGQEALALLRNRPETAVILLDVVMETMTAGLNCCRHIRAELGNRFVRILLRTGQPGVAPERQVIDEYDIDGYLPKAELTATRLYSAVRTAIKAFEELLQLERHRQVLSFVHRSATALHPFEPMELTLRRILETAVAILPVPLAVLCLDSCAENGDPRRCLMHVASQGSAESGESAAAAVARQIAASPAALRQPGALAHGFVVPLVVHRELGHGWIYVQGQPDEIVQQAMPLLAAHAANALYASIAQAMLAAREGPFYESVTV
jgi:CheY-like chemotaxis protein